MAGLTTPGPWEAVSINGGLLVREKTGRKRVLSRMAVGQYASPNPEADNVLMAAAPEMRSALRDALDELKKWQDFGPDDPDVDSVIFYAEKALAKAEGE